MIPFYCKYNSLSQVGITNILLILLFAISCRKDGKPVFSTLTDKRDGITYKVVQIGNQVWMAENLRYLPKVNVPDSISDTFCRYYIYNFSDTDIVKAQAAPNYVTYGVMYNASAALEGFSGLQTDSAIISGVCPIGWHLPNNTEWKTLIDKLGGVNVAGGKLKGDSHWMSPNFGAINISGFNALPGGYLSSEGEFLLLGIYSLWWSATQYNEESAFAKGLHYDCSFVYETTQNKKSGLYVRCIKD